MGPARALPVRVLCRLLGIHDTSAAVLARLVTPIIAMIDHGRVPLADVRRARQALEDELESAFFSLDDCNGPLGAAILDGIAAGTLTRKEAADNTALLFVAGTATTTAAIAHAIHLVVTMNTESRREALDAVERPGFLREVLRLQPPVRYTPRFAARRVRLGEIALEPGAMVQVCIASANRDPRAYHRSHLWSLDRDLEPAPLTFGRGLHSCLGAFLAELEVIEVLRYARSTLERASLVDVPKLQPGWTLRVPAELIVST